MARTPFHKTPKRIDDPVVKVSIGLRQSVIMRLDDIAKEHGTTRSALVQEHIDDLLLEEG